MLLSSGGVINYLALWHEVRIISFSVTRSIMPCLEKKRMLDDSFSGHFLLLALSSSLLSSGGVINYLALWHEVRIISFSVTRSIMPCLEKKRMLDDSFSGHFLLLALSSSWADDMCSQTSLVVA